MEANELSCKDLIIGDWVDVRNNASPNTPHLERITPSHFLRDEHWYGVELVPEILEKNGFRIVYESEFYVSYFQDIQGFHTEVKVDKDGIFQKLSMWDGFGNQVTIIECKFVHQLQNALRLCGIPREIII